MKDVTHIPAAIPELTTEKPRLSMADYFNMHRDKIIECIPVTLARRVEAGGTVCFHEENRAIGKIIAVKEPGYELCGYSLSGAQVTAFMPLKEYGAANLAGMDDAPQAIAKKDLPPGTRVLASPMGEGLYHVDSPDDAIPNTQTHYYLHTRFNVTAAHLSGPDVKKNYAVVARGNETPLRGIVLAEDETFHGRIQVRKCENRKIVPDYVRVGEIRALAGSFLYEDPAALNGYTLAHPDFTRYGLRRMPVTPPARRLPAPKA